MATKTTYLALFVTSILCGIGSYSQSNTLTVAFTRLDAIYKGTEVRVNGLPIGKVSNFKPTSTMDTIFVILNITAKVRIPKGSQFYVDENLIGSTVINVELSKEDVYLTSKDISIGTFRPFPMISPSQLDSAKQQPKIRLSPPKVDSVKN